jgi:ankyrin repeat protein
MFQKGLAGKSAVIFGMFLVILVSGTLFASDIDKNQALGEACEKGNLEDVKRLLSQGADANAETNGWTALMQASGEGHAEIVKLLLEKGVDPRTWLKTVRFTWVQEPISA